MTEGRVLYHTHVDMEDGEVRAFLMLYDAKFSIVAIRLEQIDRVRNHTWAYNEIKRIESGGSESRRTIRFEFCDIEGHMTKDISISFGGSNERDLYLFRFTALMKIYRPKGLQKIIFTPFYAGARQAAFNLTNRSPKYHEPYSPTTRYSSSESERIDRDSNTDHTKNCLGIQNAGTPSSSDKQSSTNCTNRVEPSPVHESRTNSHISSTDETPASQASQVRSSEPHIQSNKSGSTTLQVSICDIDDMFSIENLKKLAVTDDSVFERATDDKGNSIKSENGHGSEITIKKAQLKVPIKVKLGDAPCDIRAELRMTVDFNINQTTLAEVRQTKEEKIRLEKLRNLIHLDASQCELCFV